jgi:hypothetical protein
MTRTAYAPQAILDRLVTLFPEFAPCWHDPKNLFRQEDGAFTQCGVFCEFSHFFRDRYEQLLPERVAALGAFISECVASSDNELSDAAATCFLENVAAERFSREFERHLSGSALQFYQQWDHAN